MQEPINPIKILKDGQIYEPYLFVSMKKPFIFACGNIHLEVTEEDTPNYFKRKNNNGVLNLTMHTLDLVLKSIKYRIEKTTKDGQLIGYWINSNGMELKEN